MADTTLNLFDPAVYEENGRVLRIAEKPAPGTSATNWNSADPYASSLVVFEELASVKLSPRGEYELTSAVSQLIEKGRLVLMHAVTGVWLDVGRPEDLAEAGRLLTTPPPSSH